MTSCVSNNTSLMTIYMMCADDPCQEQLASLREHVRDIIDYTETYDNAQRCHEFIRFVRYERIFLIVTSTMVEQLFEQNIHEIRHVQAILVFDPYETMAADEHLPYSSYKIKGVFKSHQDLTQCLWTAVQECVNKSDVLLSCFASCSDDATTNVINNFADLSESWYPLFIDLLVSESVMPDDKINFINECRLYFSRNIRTLAMIDEFEKTFDYTSALSYYSRDGFLYRTINRALRRQNIASIINLTFFLRKIQRELQSAYMLFEMKYDIGEWMAFFRGQRMSRDELEKLQKKYREGTLITANSYLSTSMSREVALVFAGTPVADAIPLLFEINAQFKDSKLQRLKPFAYIGQFSNYGSDELEVIFSVGSFFKVEKIEYNDFTSLCTVKMTFIDDEEEKLTVVEDFRALRTCSPAAKLIKIGNLLSYRSQHGLTQASTLYEIIISRHFSSILTAACYSGLGWLTLKQKNEDLAIEHQQKALLLYENLDLTNEDVAFLRMTSYNCIGTALRMKKQYNEALEYFMRGEQLSIAKTAIDKYAMYDLYKNVSSINIASVYKQMNQIDRAWEKYKKILAYEMNNSNRFHGHTFLTIAQAGLSETCMAHQKRDYQEYSKSWKAFLDRSLTDMSSSYRRSIVSGVLLIGFEFETNERTREMAIDYFKKIISISSKYVNVSRDDYYIVLKCYIELMRLYRKTKQNYQESVRQAILALELCRKSDLESIFECYKCLTETVEEQYLKQEVELTPDDICTKLCETPPQRYHAVDSIEDDLSERSTLIFKRSEFAFGQYKTALNPNLMLEHDHKRRYIYCHLKMAALAQDRGRQEVDNMKLKLEEKQFNEANQHEKMSNVHFQTARQLLSKVNSLTQESSIREICINNLAYLNDDFDSIISNCQENLVKRSLPCIGENMFSYIGHLYGQKGEIIEEERWYKVAIEHFEKYKHVCKHTVPCFLTLANFHSRNQKFMSTVNVYDMLVEYLNTYPSPSFLRASIVPIVRRLIQNSIERTQWKLTIGLFDHLVQISVVDDDDYLGIDKEFQNCLTKCIDIDDSVKIETYSNYFETILRYRGIFYQAHLSDIEPAFRQAIAIYATRQDTRRLISVYQTFLELIISSTIDLNKIIGAVERLALDLEVILLMNEALDVYMRLAQFILKHNIMEGKVKAGFTLVRYRLLTKKEALINMNCQTIMVQLMGYYRNIVEPQFVIDDYLKTMKSHPKHDDSATGYYVSLLEFFIKYRPQHYINQCQTTIESLKERPLELIAFIKSTRTNYILLIEALFQHLMQLNDTYSSVNLSYSIDFETEATLWLKQKDQLNDVVSYAQCLECILDLHSIDDEYLALAYLASGDATNAAAVFDKFIYGEPALRYSDNACRRYLKYVYNNTLTDQERTEMEYRYAKHFLLESDLMSTNYSFQILSPSRFDMNY